MCQGVLLFEADRTIVATAILLSIPLVTSDRIIKQFYAETVW